MVVSFEVGIDAGIQGVRAGAGTPGGARSCRRYRRGLSRMRRRATSKDEGNRMAQKEKAKAKTTTTKAAKGKATKKSGNNWTCPGLVDTYPLREEGGPNAQDTSTVFRRIPAAAR